jgi:hypothetical protein
VNAAVCPPDAVTADLVERVARRVVELLRAESPVVTPRYADAESNPLGSARAFADAARRGDFPTFRRSRRVTAKWSDVEAWIESRPSRRRTCVDEIDPAALLKDALASRGRNATARP